MAPKQKSQSTACGARTETPVYSVGGGRRPAGAHREHAGKDPGINQGDTGILLSQAKPLSHCGC